MKTAILGLLFTLIVCVPGTGDDSCFPLELGHQPVVSRHAAGLKPRRVVIVTTHNYKDRLKEQDTLARCLAKHLRNGRFFDVVISREAMCRDKLPMRRGEFDERQLLLLSEVYHADAVLYCEIEEMSAYAPMELQMSMLLVHVGEAVALASSTVTIDLRDPVIHQTYAIYARRVCDHLTTQTHLDSPTLFIDFATGHLAHSLLSIWSQ